MISFKTNALLLLLAGVALVFAFAPTHFIWLALVCPALFYALVTRHTPKQSAILGLCFGVGFFGVGISWVFVAIYVFGGTSAIISALITILFVLVLAVFFACMGFLLQQYFPKNNLVKALLVYPSLWVLLEVLRSSLFTGFPWLILGHSLAGSLFAGFAPIVGPYGCSFLMIFASSLFLMAVMPHQAHGILYSWKISNVALLTFIILVFSAHAFSFIPWTKAKGKPLSVTLVQGNIQQSLRWDPEEVNRIMMTYQTLTEKYYHSDLIIWPEAAIPLTPEEAKPLLQTLEEKLAPTHSALLTGMPITNGLRYYNAVVSLGEAEGVYAKRHLVPFGEYVPLEKWLRGIIQFFNLPMSNMIPGQENQSLISVHHIPIGVYVCYEVAYDHIVRNDLPSAGLLVTVSDDAWFGKSLAPWQHLQIGQFQALATGREMLFVGNNGITAIIDHQGRVQGYLAQFTPAVLTGQVQAYFGQTPWVRLGDMPWIILMIVGLAWGAFRCRKV